MGYDSFDFQPKQKIDLPINYNEADWKTRRLAREQYIDEQNGKCKYCGAPLKDQPAQKVRDAIINWRLFPKGFQEHPVHLHHNHITGMTIGAVHMRCNAYLWQYEKE